MDQRSKWMVTARFEKRALLIAVNCLAGLSIFFFGKFNARYGECGLH